MGIALVTPTGRFLAVNEALCPMLGRPESGLLPMELREVTHPDDLATSQALVEKVVAGAREGFQLEKCYLHADGHLIWGQVSVSCLRQQSVYRPGESMDALMARADAAMYDASQSVRDRVIAIPAERS